MTIQESYVKFLQKVNKDNTSDNVYVDKGRFVLIFNEQQNRWLEQQFTKRDFQSLLGIQELLVDDLELINGTTIPYQKHIEFKLPEDYFNYVTAYVLADKGDCKNKIVRAWLIKPFDINDKVRDEYNKPSFEYEETLLIIANGHIHVYFDDFVVNKLVFSYYRFAKQVDIAGYIRIDGTNSTDIDPELTDQFVDEIISRCAEEVMRDFENQSGFGFSKDRIRTEE